MESKPTDNVCEIEDLLEYVNKHIQCGDIDRLVSSIQYMGMVQCNWCRPVLIEYIFNYPCMLINILPHTKVGNLLAMMLLQKYFEISVRVFLEKYEVKSSEQTDKRVVTYRKRKFKWLHDFLDLICSFKNTRGDNYWDDLRTDYRAFFSDSHDRKFAEIEQAVDFLISEYIRGSYNRWMYSFCETIGLSGNAFDSKIDEDIVFRDIRDREFRIDISEARLKNDKRRVDQLISEFYNNKEKYLDE